MDQERRWLSSMENMSALKRRARVELASTFSSRRRRSSGERLKRGDQRRSERDVSSERTGGQRPVAEIQPRGITKRFSLVYRNCDRRSDTVRRRAYLNVSGDKAAAVAATSSQNWLRSSGPQFSLRGEMVMFTPGGLKKKEDYFHLGSDGTQHCRWCEPERRHVAHHPTRINRVFFHVPLIDRGGNSLEELEIITRKPSFPCINVPMPEQYDDADEKDALDREDAARQEPEDSLGLEIEMTDAGVSSMRFAGAIMVESNLRQSSTSTMSA